MKQRTFIWALLALLLIPALSFGAAPTEVYVDPSIAANSGTGSIGDPYGDTQYALDTEGRDATNGNRFNIKAGTAEILAATLVLTTYGVPTNTAPLIIQGYTSVANDGGQGEIDGDGTYGCFSGSEDSITMKDMEVHNAGSAVVIDLDQYACVQNCEVHDSTGNLIVVRHNSIVEGCDVYDGSAFGILLTGGSSSATKNYVSNAAKNFTSAILISDTVTVVRNIVSISGASTGINSSNKRNPYIRHNSILSSGGTGAGIRVFSTARQGSIANNIVEGFIGVGGDGIDYTAHTANWLLNAGNAFYNNATNELNKPVGKFLIDTDNESLGSSAFAKSGANTFANRHIYFAPLDVGNVWAGAYPVGGNLDKGAVQHVDAGGTTVIVIDD